MDTVARREAFERYLRDVPMLHSWDDGRTWNSGGFGHHHLTALFELVQTPQVRAFRVLETGAGNSTLCFLLAGAAAVTSIAPDRELFARILAYCAVAGISTSAWNAVADMSERALPGIAAKARETGDLIDFVLIDGSHGWPAVFVDFCYAYSMLRQGGHMMIDDIQIHAVKELARFMSRSWLFELVRDLGKSLVFQKVAEQTWMGDFGGQRYIMDRMDQDRAAGSDYILF